MLEELFIFGLNNPFKTSSTMSCLQLIWLYNRPPQAQIDAFLIFLGISIPASVGVFLLEAVKMLFTPIWFSHNFLRLSHAVTSAWPQPWILLSHTVQLYWLKSWNIAWHMQKLIHVHFRESITTCRKSACSLCCVWLAETTFVNWGSRLLVQKT